MQCGDPAADYVIMRKDPIATRQLRRAEPSSRDLVPVFYVPEQIVINKQGRPPIKVDRDVFNDVFVCTKIVYYTFSKNETRAKSAKSAGSNGSITFFDSQNDVQFDRGKILKNKILLPFTSMTWTLNDFNAIRSAVIKYYTPAAQSRGTKKYLMDFNYRQLNVN